MSDMHLKLSHLYASSVLLGVESPHLGASASSSFLLAANEEEVLLPADWIETRYCPSCRALRIQSKRIADHRRNPRRRLFQCGICSSVYKTESPSAESKALFPRTNSKAYQRELPRTHVGQLSPMKRKLEPAESEQKTRKRPNKGKQGLAVQLAKREEARQKERTQATPSFGLADFLKAL